MSSSDRNSGQSFIGRNRTPRVHIEYEVGNHDSPTKVRLPFIMGVLADLTGKASLEDGQERPIAKDKFLEIDVDNFSERMKAMQPRASFRVANTLSNEGELPVNLLFETMEDFTPAAVARQIAPLNELLEARKKLADLLAYADCKPDAERLIDDMLKNENLLRALAAEKNN